MNLVTQRIHCETFKGSPVTSLRKLVDKGYTPASLSVLMLGVLGGKGFFADRLVSRDVAGALMTHPRDDAFEVKIVPYTSDLLALLELKHPNKSQPCSGGYRITEEEYSSFEGRVYPSTLFNRPFTKEEVLTCAPWIDLVGNDDIYRRWVDEVYKAGALRRREKGLENMALLVSPALKSPHVQPLVLQGLNSGSNLSGLEGFTGKSGYLLGIKPA